MRRIQRLFLLLMIVGGILLSACGGGGSDSDSQSEAATSAPLLVENAEANTTTTTTTDNTQETQQPEVAAEVNGEAISMEELERQVEIFEAGTTAEAADRDALIGTVLERLIEQKLIEQAAAEMGITVSDEDVQAEIASLQVFASEQGITVEDYFAAQGISPEELPDNIRSTLLATAVNEQVAADTPQTITQVHARHILVKDEALALDIINQLNNGADFAALAAQYSQDPSTKDFGGDLGWIAPGDLLQVEVEATIFALPANSRAPEPIQSILGYHIIESIERDDTRPIDAAKYAELRQKAWIDWLAQQRAKATIIRYVGPNS